MLRVRIHFHRACALRSLAQLEISVRVWRVVRGVRAQARGTVSYFFLLYVEETLEHQDILEQHARTQVLETRGRRGGGYYELWWEDDEDHDGEERTNAKDLPCSAAFGLHWGENMCSDSWGVFKSVMLETAAHVSPKFTFREVSSGSNHEHHRGGSNATSRGNILVTMHSSKIEYESRVFFEKIDGVDVLIYVLLFQSSVRTCGRIKHRIHFILDSSITCDPGFCF